MSSIINKLKAGDPIMLAGIAGSMFALVYTKNLTVWKALCTSIGGTVAAMFLAPAMASGWSPEVASAISFLLGVFAMSLFGIVFEVIDRVKASPIKTLSDITGIVIDVLLAFRNGQQRRKTDNITKDDNGTSSD